MTASSIRQHSTQPTDPTAQARMITKSSVVTSLVVRAALCRKTMSDVTGEIRPARRAIV